MESSQVIDRRQTERAQRITPSLPIVRVRSKWIDCLEWGLACSMLMAALPVIGLLWGVIRLTSRGSGFYRQRRAGQYGQEFWIYKLRTMRTDCERTTGAVWATANDPRVTTVGRWLRRSHLDELPQLFNVIRGEMNLVGPRPERPEIIARLVPEIPNYLNRLAVRPGITGLAQLCVAADRTLDDVRAKLRHDLYYLRKRSVWLDLRIIVGTALKVIGLNTPATRHLLGLELNAPRIERGLLASMGGGIVISSNRGRLDKSAD